MKILMMTNTYRPHVGGVARSVDAFTEEYRRMGHHVIVVAPEFTKNPVEEKDIIRIPAIQRFNGSDFSVRIPIPGFLDAALGEFEPDIVHSHHPFLMGDTALCVAHELEIPIVFTHHTMYEQYTHYVPGDSPAIKRFVIKLSTGYANLCDQVIAPSESIAKILVERGVETPVSVIPTGIDLEEFGRGDGAEFRRSHGVPEDAYVVGHVGRLAPEKNLAFLSRSVARYLERNPRAHYLVVGDGPSANGIREIFEKHNIQNRLHMTGSLQGQELVDSYHAMDIFAFASKSETQGMVVSEAMAVPLPVVAIDAPGVREVVEDGRNGRLLMEEDEAAFADALEQVASLDEEGRRRMKEAALATAKERSRQRSAEKAIELYSEVLSRDYAPAQIERSAWDQALNLLKAEWDIFVNKMEAAGAAIQASLTDKKEQKA